LCGQCLKKTPEYEHTFAPFIYQGAIRHLIKGLKFNNHYKNAKLLGSLFAEQLQQDSDLPECIIPVPLHKNRYQERGFNQSLEIAHTVAKQLRIPLELNACIRHRDTPHQLSLPAKQRHENIKNAFSIVKPIHYSHIALLDDVMTTGSTVAEITGVLKKTGVQRVDVWVCARA
jgi:ComF family protein